MASCRIARYPSRIATLLLISSLTARLRCTFDAVWLLCYKMDCFDAATQQFNMGYLIATSRSCMLAGLGDSRPLVSIGVSLAVLAFCLVDRSHTNAMFRSWCMLEAVTQQFNMWYLESVLSCYVIFIPSGPSSHCWPRAR